MRIPQHILDQARNLAESDQLMEYFVKFYDFVTSNSAYESYVTRKNYLDKWNAELSEKDVELINNITVKQLAKSNGELNSDAALLHDKAVDRAMKYFEGQLKFLKDTEEIKAMLTPQEQVIAATDPRIRKTITDIAL